MTSHFSSLSVGRWTLNVERFPLLCSAFGVRCFLLHIIFHWAFLLDLHSLSVQVVQIQLNKMMVKIDYC